MTEAFDELHVAIDDLKTALKASTMEILPLLILSYLFIVSFVLVLSVR